MPPGGCQVAPSRHGRDPASSPRHASPGDRSADRGASRRGRPRRIGRRGTPAGRPRRRPRGDPGPIGRAARRRRRGANRRAALRRNPRRAALGRRSGCGRRRRLQLGRAGLRPVLGGRSGRCRGSNRLGRDLRQRHDRRRRPRRPDHGRSAAGRSQPRCLRQRRDRAGPARSRQPRSRRGGQCRRRSAGDHLAGRLGSRRVAPLRQPGSGALAAGLRAPPEDRHPSHGRPEQRPRSGRHGSIDPSLRRDHSRLERHRLQLPHRSGGADLRGPGVAHLCAGRDADGRESRRPARHGGACPPVQLRRPRHRHARHVHRPRHHARCAGGAGGPHRLGGRATRDRPPRLVRVRKPGQRRPADVPEHRRAPGPDGDGLPGRRLLPDAARPPVGRRGPHRRPDRTGRRRRRAVGRIRSSRRPARPRSAGPSHSGSSSTNR